MPKQADHGVNIGYEAELWKMADALRGSMDADSLINSKPDIPKIAVTKPSSDDALSVGESRGEGVAVYRDIPGLCKSATIE